MIQLDATDLLRNQEPAGPGRRIRAIEESIPFAALSALAEQESWRKEVYRPVYYLHKWWARRLGSVFRGIIIGSCIDNPNDFWDRFYGANDFAGTTVFDPFMGSGVTVGEALKLGCRVIGRDINSVAFLASSAAFARYDTREVTAAYELLRNTLQRKLLDYYRTKTSSGEDATVLYYFLVKTVSCPICSAPIELFPSRVFSANAVPRKDPTARALCPGCHAICHTEYNARRTVCAQCGASFDPQKGVVEGPHVTCPGCQARFRLVDRMVGLTDPLPVRRYAKMILTSQGEKRYEGMNDFDRQLEQQIAAECRRVESTFPRVAVEPGYNTDQMLKHNYRYWHQLFSDRQLVCIKRLVEEIRALPNPDIRLLFSCLLSGTLEFNNLFTSFKGEGTGAVRHMFSHHVLKPELMPLEANIWGTSKSSGAFSCLFQSRVLRALAYKSRPTEIWLANGTASKLGGFNKPLSADIAHSFAKFRERGQSLYLSRGDSSCTDILDKAVDVVITDPPFFDNVHYSQLADFFNYWLCQLLDVPLQKSTRSASEVQDTDPVLFTAKLTSVFAECHRVLKDEGLLVFTYHHSRHEGWTAVHRAIRHAGFVCSRSFPIKAEMSVSMPLQQAKTPIHLDLILVCHKIDGEDVGLAQPADVAAAISAAKRQIAELTAHGIRVSLGDAKVVLMGQMLLETHKMRSLEQEECFLRDRETEIDSYVSQVLSTEGEIIYRAPESAQMTLFERLEPYVAERTAGHPGGPHGG